MSETMETKRNDQAESNQMENNKAESNQVESNQVESNQIKSDRTQNNKGEACKIGNKEYKLSSARGTLSHIAGRR